MTTRVRSTIEHRIAARAACIAILLSGLAHAQATPPAAPPAKGADSALPKTPNDSALPKTPNDAPRTPSDGAAPKSTTDSAVLKSPGDTAAPKSATDTASTAGAASKTDELEKKVNDLESRLQAAEEGIAQAESRAEENKLRLYGFSDVGFRKSWIKDGSVFENIMDESPTFLLGSTNVYFEAQPHPAFRSLTEVRFSLYPNGVPGTDFKPSQSATVYDLTSGSGRNKVAWSGIVLERAVLEWKLSDAFKVMGGYFLTPYGIWNVDHGSPTLISTSLPNFFALEYFPTHLTGLQFLGSFTTGDWELGYRAYLSNGRNRILFDNQKDKLIGARLYATARANWGSITLGGSAFRGSYLEKDFSISYTQENPEATFHVDSKTSIQYEEWGAAADLSLDAGPLRLRSEFVFNRTDYVDPYRAKTASGAFYPDRSRWNTYFLGAYRLPWLGLEPFVYTEYDHRPDTTADRSVVLSGGLNINLTPSAKIKSQYFHALFLGTFEDTRKNDFDLLDIRFVLAY